MDVDHPVKGIRRIKGAKETWGEHLHVLGQDHQLNAVLSQQLQMARFRLSPVGIADRHMLKASSKLLGDRAQIRMVGHHQGHPHRQLPGAHPPEQIQQAVVLLAHKDGHSGLLIREGHLLLAAQPLGQGRRRRSNSLVGQAETLKLPLNTAQKQAGTLIAVVIGMHDVAAIARHPTGELPHQAGLVLADHLKDGRSSRHGGAGRSPETMDSAGRLLTAGCSSPRERSGAKTPG